MIIKNDDELSKVKTAAKINTECLLYLKELVEPGISSLEIDKKAEEFYKNNDVIPAFKGVPGKFFPYPATINFQINNQVVHNIPNENQIVKEGDLVSIDTGCIYKEYYADHAASLGVGKISDEDERLLNTAKLSVEAGCKQAKAGNHVGDIGNAQQTVIEMAGFSVVKVLCGHEIGKSLWGDLKILAYGKPGTGEKLKENLLICIENQTNAGSDKVYTGEDGWVVYTQDGKNSLTFEHMVIIKKDGPEIITKV